ncbi:hypothetical protein [Streptomyces aidingensis]|uniref:Head-to-tail adaptor n=1 Tax=Streptomyces aidingensis TaxID=910347 RepID=A0A1I1Q577_9ACTN|nr:hypothetical protein [Streptomyces aidingensis]SFD14373.1 hypothetical protein SAMN05421773_110112 [Streptomyces aidingensis]
MPALATQADLEARLGRPLTAEEQARAGALLAGASARVRAYTRQEFDLVHGDVVVLRPVGTVVRLPQRPVLAVSSVVALGGAETIPDITLPGGAWTWDGADKVDIWPPDQGWLLSLPESWSSGWGGVDSYRVTYDHGYATIPEQVVEAVCAMVLRSLLSPSLAPGMVSERIGNYSYQMQQGGGAAGATVSMTEDDRDLLRDFRVRATTIQTRAR